MKQSFRVDRPKRGDHDYGFPTRTTHCMSGHSLRWLSPRIAVCVPSHVTLWRDAGTYLIGESGPLARELVAALSDGKESR